MYVCMYVCMHVLYVCMYVCTYVCMYSMYAHTYVCTDVHMYVRTYMYTYVCDTSNKPGTYVCSMHAVLQKQVHGNTVRFILSPSKRLFRAIAANSKDRQTQASQNKAQHVDIHTYPTMDVHACRISVSGQI